MNRMQHNQLPHAALLAVLVIAALVAVQAGLIFHQAHHSDCSSQPTGSHGSCFLCLVATALVAISVVLLAVPGPGLIALLADLLRQSPLLRPDLIRAPRAPPVTSV